MDKIYIRPSLKKQIEIHEKLKKKLVKNISIFNPPYTHIQKNSIKWNTKIDYTNILNPNIFKYEIVSSFESKKENQIIVRGIMSQYNCCNSGDRFVPDEDEIDCIYSNSSIEGTEVLPKEYLGVLCKLAKNGFNSLVHTLDSMMCYDEGILTPTNDFNYSKVITHSHLIDFVCINDNNSRYLFGSAPAFGSYSDELIDSNKKKEICFIFAYLTYKSQFKYVSEMNEDIPIVFKPCLLGIGSFDNDIQMIAKAFYVVAKGFERVFLQKGIRVIMQIYDSQLYSSQYLIDKLFT